MVNKLFFFLVIFLWFWIDCGDASRELRFALLPKMVQDNQNNLTVKLKDKKVKGYVLGIGT